MAVARQSEVDQSVNNGPRRPRNRQTTLTSRFKVWRNPARFHIGLFPISWVFHASPCAGFDACHEPGIGTGMPAASLADDIKPKAPETAFSGKLRPDILGVSTESNAESERTVFD